MTYQKKARAPEDDEDPTLRMNGQRMASNRQPGHGREGQLKEAPHEDLFLDLARGDSVIEDASEVTSRSERRRVSGPYLRSCCFPYVATTAFPYLFGMEMLTTVFGF